MKIKNIIPIFWITLFVLTVNNIYALDTSQTRTINITTAGNLSTLLPQDEREYVVNLTLKGKLNGTDFNILRTMATSQNLQVLDMSEANIVSGGDSYYNNYGTNYYTKNNEFGYSLFGGCKKIKKIVLPNSLVTIGQCAFWYCTSLKTLVIGSKVTTIKPGVWGGCRELSDVQISNNSNFHLIDGILYNKGYTIIIAALQTWNYGNLTIRSGVKEIQYNAFAFCSKLTGVTFPSSVTTIGDTAFEYTGIAYVNFTNSVTSIGSFAFSGCSDLKNVDLTPLKLTSLDYGVFMTSNIEIVYLPKTLNELKQSVFSRTQLKHIFVYTATPASMYDLSSSSPTFKDVDTNSCIVHVPNGKVNIYKAAAGWKDFQYITDSQDIEPLYSNLQEFIDSKAGVTGVVEVDLSKFENDLVRVQTLNVSTGASYRFINGTLDRAGSLEGPVLFVTNDSKVEIGSGAIITGQGHSSSIEIVRLERGTINVSQGSVEGTLWYPVSYIGNPYQSDAVRLTTSYDHFYLGNGTIYGTLSCDVSGADVKFNGGKLIGLPDDISQSSTPLRSPRKATPVGSRSPLISTYSDIYINQTTSKDYAWGGSIIVLPPGNNDITDNLSPFHVALKGQSKVHLQHKYEKGFVFTVDDRKDGDIVMIGENYQITDTDLAAMIVNSFLYYSDADGHYKEQECYLELRGNTVYLRYKKEPVCDSDDLQRFLEQMAGIETETDVPLCDEPTIDDDVEVDDIQIWIDGTDQEPPLVIEFYGGTINIHQNAGMSFKGVSFASKNNAKESSLRTIGNGGGISNSGTLRFENCTFLSGGYTIENNGETYINAGVAGCRLTNKRGGRIHINSPLTDELTVTVPTAADVEQGVAVITGVSNTDHIQMSLPSGYAYKYDSTAGGIVVYSTTGITSVEQQVTVKESFDATGRKVENNRIGLTIQRMSDGMVKKVIINQ